MFKKFRLKKKRRPPRGLFPVEELIGLEVEMAFQVASSHLVWYFIAVNIGVRSAAAAAAQLVVLLSLLRRFRIPVTVACHSRSVGRVGGRLGGG